MQLHVGGAQDGNGYTVLSKLKQASMFGELWTKEASDGGSKNFQAMIKI